MPPTSKILTHVLKYPENSVIGTNIGTVSAVDEDKTDPERDVGYYIVDGTGLGFFDIDQNTGKWAITCKTVNAFLIDFKSCNLRDCCRGRGYYEI